MDDALFTLGERIFYLPTGDSADGVIVMNGSGARDLARRLLVAMCMADGLDVPHVFYVDNVIDNKSGGLNPCPPT